VRIQGRILFLVLAVALAAGGHAAPSERWTLQLSQQDFLAATNAILKLAPDRFTPAQRMRMLERVDRAAYWEDAMSDQDAPVWAILSQRQRPAVKAAVRRLRETGAWKAGLPRPSHEYMERFLRLAERRGGARRPAAPPLARPDSRPPDMQPLTEMDGQPYEVACVMPELVEAGTVTLTRDQWRAFVAEYAMLRRTEEVLNGEYVALSRIPDARQQNLIAKTSRRLGPAHIDLYRHVLDLQATLRALR